MLWKNSLLKKTLLSKFHSGWKSPQKDSFYKIASEASKGCLNVLVKNMHQNLPFLARKIKYGTFWVIFKQCDLSSHFRYAQGKLTFGTFFYFYGESDRLTNFFQASMGFLMHWLQLLKWASKQKCTSFSYPTRNCSLFTVFFTQLINVGSISFKQADAFVFYLRSWSARYFWSVSKPFKNDAHWLKITQRSLIFQRCERSECTIYWAHAFSSARFIAVEML